MVDKFGRIKWRYGSTRGFRESCIGAHLGKAGDSDVTSRMGWGVFGAGDRCISSRCHPGIQDHRGLEIGYKDHNICRFPCRTHVGCMGVRADELEDRVQVCRNLPRRLPLHRKQCMQEHDESIGGLLHELDHKVKSIGCLIPGCKW